MSFIGTLESFDVSKSDFETYLERFEQLVKINTVEDKNKMSLFITLMGAETYNVLKNLCVPDSPLVKSYDFITKLLKSHFNPEKLVIFERFKFNKRDQSANETIAEYIIELKRLTRTCSFDAFLNNALRDRLICGLRSESIQKKLLSEGGDLTFEDACRKAVSLELATIESKTISDSSVSKIWSSKQNHLNPSVATNFNQNDRRFNNKLCDKCGRNHSDKFCPAKNWRCFLCNKRGHVKELCWNKKKINNLEEEEVEDTLENLNLIGMVASRKAEPQKILLKINDVQIKVEVDTGACASVMEESYFYKYFPKAKLEKEDLKYRSVTGEKLVTLGRFEVLVEYECKNYSLTLVVIRAKQLFTTLIGRNWLD